MIVEVKISLSLHSISKTDKEAAILKLTHLTLKIKNTKAIIPQLSPNKEFSLRILNIFQQEFHLRRSLLAGAMMNALKM